MGATMQEFSPLEMIIQNEFFDSKRIIDVVRKYDFEKKLYPGFHKVDILLKSKELSKIPNIVGALLVTINDSLAKVQGQEKEILEILASELFSTQIGMLNQSHEGQICWAKCREILIETCELKMYDLDALSRFLKFDVIRKPKSLTSQNVKRLPYYVWHGNVNELAELIKDIKDKNWIDSVKEFNRLFMPIHNQEYTFTARRENLKKLLILFSVLKLNKLVSVKNSSGHFVPLQLYAVANQEKLFQKEPKRYLELLKRKPIEYDKILKEVQRLIKHNIRS